MKNALKSIWNLLCEMGHARHAAELARNGKIKQAQECYANNIGICRGL